MITTVQPLLLLIALIGAIEEREYEYVPDTSGYVELDRGEEQLIGKLDEKGTFVRDLRWQGLKKGFAQSSIPPLRVLNTRCPGWEHVYEYRSGRLILGELDREGNFVPDVGSKVINFKDYRYRPDGIQIYNLPGRFMKKSEAKKEDAKNKDGK